MDSDNLWSVIQKEQSDLIIISIIILLTEDPLNSGLFFCINSIQQCILKFTLNILRVSKDRLLLTLTTEIGKQCKYHDTAE